MNEAKRLSMRKVWAGLLALTVILVTCTVPTRPSSGTTDEKELERQIVTTGQEAPVTTTDTATAEPLAPPPAASAVKAEPTSTNEDETTGENTTSDIDLSASVLLTVFEDNHRLRPVDPFTGQDLDGYPPIALGGGSFSSAVSPDGKTMAVVTQVTRLHFVDLVRWQDTVTELRFPGVMATTFSPDGSKLAVAFDGPHLALVDVAAQMVVAEATLDFSPRLLRFTPEGDALILYGTVPDPPGSDQMNAGPARVALFQAADLALVWEATLAGVRDGVWCEQECGDWSQPHTLWQPAVVWAPHGRSLYVVHAHEDRLTTVDLEAHTVTTADIRPAQSWLDRFLSLTAGVARAKVIEGATKRAVVSPDGSRLYVVGLRTDVETGSDSSPSIVETPLGLKVVATDSGLELATLETEARSLALSEDGNHVYLYGWGEGDPWTDRLDLTRLEIDAHLEGFHARPLLRLDGRSLLLDNLPHQGQTRLAVIDPDSFEVVASWTSDGYAGWVSR